MVCFALISDIMYSLLLLCRGNELYLRSFPGRILPKQSPGEAICDRGPPQRGVLLCGNLVDVGMLVPPRWISMETALGFAGGNMHLIYKMSLCVFVFRLIQLTACALHLSSCPTASRAG